MRRGDEYRIGERQEQSFERAVDYYHRAARRNYAPAQYMMGIMYESGHGVPQSYKEAAKWYEKAFNQGYRRATSAMAFLWESGLGVKRSRSLAIEHYSTAAEGGDPVLRRRQDGDEREEAFARFVEEPVVAGEGRDGDADRPAGARMKRRRPVALREVDRPRVPHELRVRVRQQDALARRHPRLEPGRRLGRRRGRTARHRQTGGGAQDERRKNARHGGDCSGTEHRLQRGKGRGRIRAGRPFCRPFYHGTWQNECNIYGTFCIPENR